MPETVLLFTTSVHTLAAYQAASAEFVAANGFTPLDAVRNPDGLAADVVSRAQFLDAWDVWLFSNEAAGV